MKNDFNHQQDSQQLLLTYTKERREIQDMLRLILNECESTEVFFNPASQENYSSYSSTKHSNSRIKVNPLQ